LRRFSNLLGIYLCCQHPCDLHCRQHRHP
jgi:hypothetical protein